MVLDVRIPIGVMFVLIGALLFVFGLVSPQRIYDEHSLGININLGWGLVLLSFGGVMLWLARISRRSTDEGSSQAS